ncbi:unknown [Salmonella phage FelixO1]|uniref:Uncharacterized protein n=1 Tax=Salmonella phage Felix O1 (isolate Felix O1-VT1) TaxID=1283336 RepID=Q6KGP5_BPFO1|nr:unknown [Salmonella phage FelixO1]
MVPLNDVNGILNSCFTLLQVTTYLFALTGKFCINFLIDWHNMCVATFISLHEKFKRFFRVL